MDEGKLIRDNWEDILAAIELRTKREAEEEEELTTPFYLKMLKRIVEIAKKPFEVGRRNMQTAALDLLAKQEKEEEYQKYFNKRFLNELVLPQKNREEYRKRYFSEPSEEKIESQKKALLNALGTAGVVSGGAGLAFLLKKLLSPKNVVQTISKIPKKENILNQLLANKYTIKRPSQTIKGLIEKLRKSKDPEEQELIKSLIKKYLKRKK